MDPRSTMPPANIQAPSTATQQSANLQPDSGGHLSPALMALSFFTASLEDLLKDTRGSPPHTSSSKYFKNCIYQNLKPFVQAI